MTRREWPPLLALGLVLGITALWWALALWPLPADAPAWLAHARFVCFGAARDTLPSSAGWLLLIGEPVALLAALGIVWGAALGRGVRTLASGGPGRAALGLTALLVTGGLGAAAHRVAAATAPGPAVTLGTPEPLDAPAPPLALVTQHGDTFDLARLSGRPALIVFAYGHCETVCPVAVREALAAREAVAADRRPRVVVVTLDPWRDVPARLPALATAWHLAPDDFALSGDVAIVERALDAWRVSRSRDAATGDLVHAPLTVVLDANGRVIGRSEGTPRQLAVVLGRLPRTGSSTPP